jgi:hypothetical protein
MGFELLTQPQVFTTRLTAIGGIEGYIPPFVAKFHTWTINTANAGTVFTIPQDTGLNAVGLTHAPDDAFIVNINRSILPPTEYNIDVNFKTITFNSPVPANTTINITQIGTVALTANNYVALTANNLFTGNVQVTGDVTIEDQLFVNGLVDIGPRLFMSGDGANYSWIGRRGAGSETPRVGYGIYSDPGNEVDLHVFNTNSQNALTIDFEGEVAISNTVSNAEATLHIERNDSRILQKPQSVTSPVIQQYVTNALITTRAGYEVFDPVNYNITAGGNSHRFGFNRQAPRKPVHYWGTSSPQATANFVLAGSNTLTENAQNYIVTVGGLIQPWTTYAVNSATRVITFDENIPANRRVYVLQQLNPDLAVGYDSTQVLQVTSNVTNSTKSFIISGATSATGFPNPLRATRESYVVSFQGVLQVADDVDPVYTITPANGRLAFEPTLPAGTWFTTVSRLPSATNPAAEVFEDACFVAEADNWSFDLASSTNTITLGGTKRLLLDPACYVVNIGGILQEPTSYSINPLTRVITFSEDIQSGTAVSITQVAHPEFPIKYTATVDIMDDCSLTSTGDAEQVAKFRPGELALQGAIATKPPIWLAGIPVNQTVVYDVPFDASTIVWNPTANNTTMSLRLPKASQYPGRWLNIKRINSTVTATLSVFPNILNFQYVFTPTIGAAASTSLVWAQLQSDGSNWTTVASNILT